MDTPTLLNATELADELGMGVSTVHQYANDGIWPEEAVLRWGKTIRFRLDLILAAGVENARQRPRPAKVVKRPEERPAKGGGKGMSMDSLRAAAASI